MNEPTPIDRMPGLASEADIDKLLASTGTDADKLFVDLMTAHHQGGIHMAQYAAEHANEIEVRRLATSMVTGQTGEISEMRSAARRSDTRASSGQTGFSRIGVRKLHPYACVDCIGGGNRPAGRRWLHRAATRCRSHQVASERRPAKLIHDEQSGRHHHRRHDARHHADPGAGRDHRLRRQQDDHAPTTAT